MAMKHKLPFEHQSTLRVRYAETDRMGIVWHGNYVQYFEAARTEALRACGASYRAMEEQGVMMPVVEIGVSYHRPAYYDDLLTVNVRLEKPPGARMRFEYVLYNEAGKTLAEGFTVLAFIDAQTRRPRRPPGWLRAIFH